MRHDQSQSLSLALVLSLVGLAMPAKATRITYDRDNYRDLRWLGRGNTGIAVIDDGTAVFYNPAGVAANSFFRVNFLNPFLAANQNFYDSFREVATLTSGSETLSEKFAPFLGKPLAVQGGAFPHVAVPNLVVGAWDYLDSAISYRDPVYPRLSVDARNDYGIILGSGYSYQRLFSFGASIRYQRRRAVAEDVTAGTLLSNSASLLNSLQQQGEGWGLNLGMQSRQQISDRHWIAEGIAIEDLGYTRFKSADRSKTPPAPQRMQVNFGLAYGVTTPFVDVTMLFDIRQYTNPMSFTKKIFTGIELNTLLGDIRGGLFQGYWTAGLSLHPLPFIDLDFASYAEELDAAAGQRQNRFYMIGIRTGLEMKKLQQKKQRFTLDNL